MKPHLLYFPCRNAIFDWFGETSGSGVAPVTVDLLAEQRDFECLPANRAKRITCQCSGHAGALFVVCRRRGRLRDKLYPRRYPDSGRCHRLDCSSYSGELLEPTAAPGQDKVIAPSGDYAALRGDLGDPEFRIVAMRRRNPARARTAHTMGGRGSTRVTMGLQRLARELLQRSGVCECQPQYASIRTEADFNGLVKGELNTLLTEADGASSTVLKSLPGVSFVPWSYLHPRNRKTPAGMTKCVGFGFVESLGAENEHGARQMRLSNHPECPLVVPRFILDREGRNPRSPLHSFLAHPVWVIFVAALYDGVWKIHALAPFRVTATGLIPVDSHNEELMVERLVREKRAFVRWLLPPPALHGRKFIPDFQLLDTVLREYLEVAGLMSDPNYADDIRQKKLAQGRRLLFWDTRSALSHFMLPAPTV